MGWTRRFTRRQVLAGMGVLGGTAAFDPARLLATPGPLLTKPIPATGEEIPTIGMGTWITFNVPPVEEQRAVRVEILRTFFEMGGGVIDSSPMYGFSEEVVGHCLRRIPDAEHPGLFAATKVWTPMGWLGPGQIEDSHELWGLERFSLFQIHNLLAWEAHLETLLERRERGSIRYVGMTTSHGRRHGELERIMRSEEAFDFVQLTYNLLDREAEERLLPLAADRGLAVIANRPFRRGALPDRLRGEPLPPWAGDYGCSTWPQLLLKFIVSHPAVTCAIPATSRVDHMAENMVACRGRLLDAKARRETVRWVESL